MSVAGFFVLLAISVLVRIVGYRLVPLIMPGGKLRAIAFGWAGGFVASWVDGVLWQFGPQAGGISLVAALAGSAITVLSLGIAPFIKILIGKV